jgi:hypothetical protein
MKNLVKPLVFITIILAPFNSVNINAQLKLPAINGIENDVKKVINDYPNRFANLMGEIITQNTQSTDYKCVFNADGAEETTVTKYSAKKDICSWQAVMLTTESFDKAKQKFKSLFNQLNNLTTRSGHQTIRLKGDYEQPDEKKKFNSVVFSFEPDNETTGKLKVEIVLQAYEPLEWKVKVLVYDRDREDNERGIKEE